MKYILFTFVEMESEDRRVAEKQLDNVLYYVDYHHLPTAKILEAVGNVQEDEIGRFVGEIG